MKVVTDFSDMTPEVSQVLRIDISPDRPKRVRHNAVLANQLNIEFDEVPSDATEDAGPSDRQDDLKDDREQLRAAATKDAVKGASTGAGYLRLKRATGDGSLWLGRHGGDVTIVTIANSITLVSQAELLATDDTITAQLSTEIPKALSNTTAAVRIWNLEGTGQVAFATNGAPVILNVSEEDALLVESQAVLAYTSTLELLESDDHKKQLGRRSGKALTTDKISNSSDPDRVWIIARGTGTIILRTQSS